jgi:hypothetical protein
MGDGKINWIMYWGKPGDRTVWWKMGVWGLKEIRRNNEQGICPISNTEEDWSHILRCEETRIWRHQILDKRFKNIDAEIGIRGTV